VVNRDRCGEEASLAELLEVFGEEAVLSVVVRGALVEAGQQFLVEEVVSGCGGTDG
jgi:hypothetical protein